MVIRNLVLSCLLVLLTMTAGCSAGSPNQKGAGSAASANADCTEAYAYAPGAYIINIVSGDAVILDPLSNDFLLYCTPAAARKGLEKRIADRELPPGDWKVYRVYGQWNELVTEVAPDVYMLNKPAPIVDWVN